MTPETEAGIIAGAIGIILVCLAKILSDLSLRHPNGQYFSRMGTSYPRRPLRDLPTPADGAIKNGAVDTGGYTLSELADSITCAGVTYYPTFEGNTVLHDATKYDRVDVVKIILKRDLADIHEKNDDGQTALDIAAVRGNTRIVKLLREQE